MKKFLTKFKYLWSWQNLLLVVVLVLFLFLRFWQIDNRIQFNWDQERDAWQIKEILAGNFTLIGPRVLGADNFFLGPYFYYLLAPFYFFSHLHPRGMIYFLLFYNLLFFSFAWLFLKKRFSKKVAFPFLALWAVNPAIIKADVICWNPVVIPLLVLLLWFWLEKTKSEKGWFWPTGLGFLLSLGINFHFQFMFIIIFAIAYLVFDKFKEIKKWFLIAIGFLFGFLPLIVFDLRHNFLNTKLLLKFIERHGQAGNWLAWRPVIQNYFQDGFSFPFPSLVAALILPILGFILLIQYKKISVFWRSAGFLFLIILPVFAIYGQRPSEYYFNFLWPFLILMLAKLLSNKKNWALIIFLFLFVFSFYHSFKSIHSQPLSLHSKEVIIKKIAEYNKPVDVYFDVPLGRETGYRYLLDYYQVEINHKANHAFEIVIPADKKKVNWQYDNIGLCFH